MYVPPHFASDDDALAAEVIARHGFATLVTSGEAGPFASHVPLLLDGRRLLGHVARANPQWRDLERGPVLAIFHGPHAYVSSRCYAPRPDGVPTWNYVAVHVRGAARLLPAGDETLAVVERLTAQYDPGAPRPEPEAALRLSRAIVGFEIAMDQVTTKLKLSQNRSAADFNAVVDDLASSDDASARDVATWMRRVR
jgi:transcriptional regulator